jgi:hypothetical protein
MMIEILPLLLSEASTNPVPSRIAGIWAFVAMALAALIGFACLAWCLWPERHVRAISAYACTARTLLLGGAVVGGSFILAVLAAKIGWWGQGGALLLLPLLVLGGAGIAVSARVLGERALPEGAPLGQFCLGMTALVLPGFSVIGLPVTLVAAAIGLGAWLAARPEDPQA